MFRSFTTIKISLFFWLYLLRGIFTLRVADVFRTTVLVNKLAVDDASVKVAKAFRSMYSERYYDRILNIALPVVSIYFAAFVILPFSTKIPQSSIYVIKYFTLICFLIWQTITLSSFSIDTNLVRWRDVLWQGFLFACHHIIFSIVVMSIILITFWFAGKNLIFLIFFLPGLNILVVQGLINNFISSRNDKA